MRNQKSTKNKFLLMMLCLLGLMAILSSCGKDGGESPGGKGNFTLNGASS